MGKTTAAHRLQNTLEDSHDRERVRHADQGADTRQAASMPKADRIGTTFHAGVKGEVVGKHVPPDGTGCKMQRTGSSQNRPRSVPNRFEG